MPEAAALAEVTHVLVTKDADGLFAESPQVPGLCFGRPTEMEFRRDFQPVLTSIGVHGLVLAHWQERGVAPNGQEYLIRWAEGPDVSDRIEVSRRIQALLAVPKLAAEMLDVEKTPMGEVVFVAAVPSDTLGSLMDQLYEADDALVICAAVADRGVFTMTMASGRHELEGWDTLDRYGWSRETTVSQLLVDAARGRRAERLLV